MSVDGKNWQIRINSYDEAEDPEALVRIKIDDKFTPAEAEELLQELKDFLDGRRDGGKPLDNEKAN